MATTIPGGAYLSGDTWKDANGKPLSKRQITEVEELLAQQALDREERQRQAMLLEAERDPTARAIARALTPKDAPVASSPTKDAKADK